MKSNLLLGMLVFCMSFLSKAQVSLVPFTQSMDSFQVINGTQIDMPLEDDIFHPNLPIGFSFVYNGVSTHKFGVCTNGYIAMDSLMHSGLWMPTTSSVNEVWALMADLRNSNTGGSIEYVTIGSAPNRICIIQWKDYGIFSLPYCHLNVQVQLYETSNCIRLVYGYNALSGTTGKTFQVGLSGNVGDHNLRTSTGNWLTSMQTSAWSGPGSGMFLNALNTVPSGLTFSFGTCPTVGIPFSYISGKVFNDANNNGTQDVGELPMPNVLLHESVQNFYTVSDANGVYNLLFVDSNLTYSLTAIAPTYWNVSSSPAIQTVSPLTQPVVNVNFGLYATPNIHDVTIHSIASNVPWPNANINFNTTIHNAGTVVEAGDSIFFSMDGNFTFISATPAPDVMNGDSLIWVYSNLLVNEYRNITMQLKADSTVAMGDTLHSYWTIQPISGDALSTNNYFAHHQPCISSFDPNFKSVVPEGNISKTQELEYTIHFQNTGTAPAQNVFLYDTLDVNLDVSTFKILGMTHPVTYTLNSLGNLAFTFANINLPDSVSNEPASHGAVSYTIQPKAGLSYGTAIENTASIVFDFNAAIVTNTTQNIIVEAIPNGLLDEEGMVSEFKVFPNPSDAELLITSDLDLQQAKLLLFDISGRKLAMPVSIINANKMKLDISNLVQGQYILSIEAEGKSSQYTVIKK
ncbi:MAG: T9SS type A sorting domain-containing protein [Bacteroidetes bacterium]|nr:T9SS type A sorting domain-containing protein [Bacteroidota bacterium]